MTGTKFLFCSSSYSGHLSNTTTDTIRLIIYFNKEFGLNLTKFSY